MNSRSCNVDQTWSLSHSNLSAFLSSVVWVISWVQRWMMCLGIGTGLFGYVCSTKPLTVYLSLGGLYNTRLLHSQQNHTGRLKTMITILCPFLTLILTFILSLPFLFALFVGFSFVGNPWSGAAGRDPLVLCSSGAEAGCDRSSSRAHGTQNQLAGGHKSALQEVSLWELMLPLNNH